MLSMVSEQKLQQVHPVLAALVIDAAVLTDQEFQVFEGLRSITRQREYYRKGVTRTMNSKHLAQQDGLSYAVDLVPVIDGDYRWEWALIWPIAHAMRDAARARGVKLTWGGVWDRSLLTLPTDLRVAVAEYQLRHPGPDFLDGPHYQLDSDWKA